MLSSALYSNNTVADLYQLANRALAGTYVQTPGHPSLTAIATAVDVINNAFDGCRMLGGFSNVAIAKVENSEAEGKTLSFGESRVRDDGKADPVWHIGGSVKA